MRSERHRRGAVAESKVTSKLMEMGFSVSIPFEEEKYDLIADYEGNILRVQVKRIYKEDRFYKVELRTQSANSEGTFKKKFDSDDFDVFVFYNPHLEEFYWIWSEESNERGYGRKRDGWKEHLIENKIEVGNMNDVDEHSQSYGREEIEGSVFRF